MSDWIEKLKSKKETGKTIGIIIVGIGFLVWFITSSPCH